MKSLQNLFQSRWSNVFAVAALVSMVSFSSNASATSWWERGPKLSSALEANGFGTLKFALDTMELTGVLDGTQVTLFAPTDDVFAATAEALGCTDAVDLATRLAGVNVGNSDALTAILTYHATGKRLGNERRLLDEKNIETILGADIMSGVNADGLYVMGAANGSPSKITSGPISSWRFVIYPINQILLPIAPPAGLCD